MATMRGVVIATEDGQTENGELEKPEPTGASVAANSVLSRVLSPHVCGTARLRRNLLHFRVGQLPVGTDRQPLVLERADRDPLELGDRMPDRLEHPPDLPRSSFSQDDAEPGVAFVLASGRPQPLDRAGTGRASIQRDPATQPPDGISSEGTPETLTRYSLLHPLDGWVTPRASSPSSVKSRRPSVWTSRRPTGLTMRRSFSGEQVHHRVATFGIRDGGDVAPRLAEKDVRLGPV